MGWPPLSTGASPGGVQTPLRPGEPWRVLGPVGEEEEMWVRGMDPFHSHRSQGSLEVEHGRQAEG